MTSLAPPPAPGRPALSWRDIADVDAARWAYRVAEARAAAAEADPAAGQEDVWAASLAADQAQDWLGALVRDRSEAAGASLGDWPAVVVSDVDPYTLPDDLTAGHTRPARSWYEQVHGITLPDDGPLLASVPAPADGEEHFVSRDDGRFVLGQDSGDLPDTLTAAGAGGGVRVDAAGAGAGEAGLWERLVGSHYGQAVLDYGNLHSSHGPDQDEQMPGRALTARQDWIRQLAEQTGVPDVEISRLASAAAHNHGFAPDADYRDYLAEPDWDAVRAGTYQEPDPWAALEPDWDDDTDTAGDDGDGDGWEW